MELDGWGVGVGGDVVGAGQQAGFDDAVRAAEVGQGFCELGQGFGLVGGEVARPLDVDDCVTAEDGEGVQGEVGACAAAGAMGAVGEVVAAMAEVVWRDAVGGRGGQAGEDLVDLVGVQVGAAFFPGGVEGAQDAPG